MKTIPLGGKYGAGKFATVDDEDYELVAARAWYVVRAGYIYAADSRDVPRALRRPMPMHRMILGLVPGDGLQGDHRNGDKLDNRRSNLRVCTHAENQQNRWNFKGGTSKYRGVWLEAESGLWCAVVKVDRKFAWGKRFKTEIEAAEAVREARARLLPFNVEEQIR